MLVRDAITKPLMRLQAASRVVRRRQDLVAPLAVYMVTRLFLLLATQVAAAASLSSAPITSFALVWDGIHYVDVAQYGYPDGLKLVDGEAQTSLHAFFPLYPMLIRFVAYVTPIGVIGSAILVSVIAGGVAAVLLWRLADRLASPGVATGAVLFLCLFPGSFVLGWAFSEGLMLCFVLGAALLLLSKRPLSAGILTAFATASRPNAIFFVLCFAWLAVAALRHEGSRACARYLAAGAVGSLGFVGYHVFLWQRTGEPLAWFRVQREGFGEGVRPGRRTIEVLFEELAAYNRTPAPLFTLFLVMLGMAMIGLLLWRTPVPGWLRLYGLVIVILALVSNTGPGSPRLQLVAFPAFIAAAHLLRHNARSLALGGSAMFLMVLIIGYGNPRVPPFYMWAP